MSKIVLTVGDGDAVFTVTIEVDGNIADMPTVVDDLLIPALRGAGFSDTTIGQYVRSEFVPQPEED